MKFEIYCIDNLVNGKKYIGKTRTGMEKRLQRHIYEARYGCNYALHRAIRKYGEKNFTVRELRMGELTTEAQWNQAERDAIFLFSSMVPDGYNLTAGGEGMGIPSEQTRARMSESGKKKKLSPEHIEKLRQVHLGRKRSPEARENIRQGLLKRKPYKLGPRSAETKARISAGRKHYLEGLSDEERAQIRADFMAIKANNIGRPCSPETRAKIGAGNRKKV